MRFQITVLALFFCLAAQAASKPRPGVSESASKAQQSLTGCIDEQDGQYVLLDGRMVKIASLQSASPDNEVFAKHLGRRVRVTGSRYAGQKGAFHVTRIEQMPGTCGQAK